MRVGNRGCAHRHDEHRPGVLRNRHPRAIEVFVIVAVLATALAAISFHVLEHPIRTWRTLDRYKGPVIAVGLALSVAGGVLLTPLILDVGSTSIAGGQTAGRTSGL